MRTAIWVCLLLVVAAVCRAQREDKSKLECGAIQCDWPRCEDGYHAVTLEGSCCPSCQRCLLHPCPYVGCEFGSERPPSDPCGCPVCVPPPPPSTTETRPNTASATVDTVLPTTAQTECEVDGQVFTECGTACPLVCGEERPFACTLQCVIGCSCPSDMFLDRDSNSCVRECPTTSTTTVPRTRTKPIPEDDPTGTTVPPTKTKPIPEDGPTADQNTGSTYYLSDSTHPTSTGSATRPTRPSTGRPTTGRPPRPFTGKPNSPTTEGPTKPSTTTERPKRPTIERPTGPFTGRPFRPETGRPNGRPTRPVVTTEIPKRPNTEIPTSEPPKSTDAIETIPTKPTTPFGRPKPTTENLIVDGTLPPPHKATSSTATKVTENTKPYCALRKDAGTSCLGQPVRRYYYNARHQKCKMFAYGGCGGNENRFSTLKECEATCSTG